MQFLLGVDAPVSFAAAAADPDRPSLVNTLLALPVYAIVAACSSPALPDDPRRRRRRAYTTGGLSSRRLPADRLWIALLIAP